MSSQKGNVRKCRPQKYQNKSAFKNVYHDTSKRTKEIVNTVVAGVCARCKDIIDWKIKYKKYKPLTQPKTWYILFIIIIIIIFFNCYLEVKKG